MGAKGQNSLKTEITIVYINYYSLADLKTSLTSVSEHTSVAYKVIVVNNSPLEDLSELNGYSEDVLIIDAKKNLGFGSACNMAIKAATTPCVLLLNPDTCLVEDSISLSLQAYLHLDPAETGMLSCGHQNADRSFQYSCLEKQDLPVFPFLRIPWKRLSSGPKALHNESQRVVAKHEESHYVFAVHGSFMLGKRQMLLDEPFDTDFFLYAEEIDLCRRLSNAGKRSYHFSGTSIIHTAQNAKENVAIRHQMHLSSSLLVLKTHGTMGYAFYYLLRLFRSSLLFLGLPFLPKKLKANVYNHLREVQPYSPDYLKVFRYSKRISSHLPLKSSKLAEKQNLFRGLSD